jgi:hypothetical protein
VDTTTDTAVVDAATGRRRALASDVVSVVRLRATGTVAVLSGAGAARELVVADRGGRRLVDRGDIAPGSVALTDTRLRWTIGGVRRSIKVG